jgi:hypothetical protein
MLASVLLVLFCLVAQVEEAPARPHDFWKLESERSGQVAVATFSARKAPAKGQGLLMCAHWPRPEGQAPELKPAEVIASLYSELQDFQLLGSKEVVWAGQQARLMAFKAKVGKRPVVGRSLLAQAPSGTEALLLVTNHEAQKDFRKEFERLQGAWEFGAPATSNVLYTRHSAPLD